MLFFRPFQFLDPGPLINRELELVPPHEKWIDALLAATQHPLTRRDAPREAAMTRQRLLDFLETSTNGRQKADPTTGKVPAYHFWMLLHEEQNPTPLIIAGGIGLRIGNTRDLKLYAGHIGYHVYPPARGHHYAERACRLLLPLIQRHHINPVWITCNPDNTASRRTIERLGAELIEIVPIPKEHEFYQRGEREKCRYRLGV